jgi:hypothetical protein
MPFSSKQLSALRRVPDPRHVRMRESNGKTLYYLERWFAISEANRIFGFDAWSRETIESKCLVAREINGLFVVCYLTKVRVTVEARGARIVREGHGTGECRSSSAAEAHDFALKGAETDATKRALATFGSPFGLTLYGPGSQTRDKPAAIAESSKLPPPMRPAIALPPDDTTPIPRPSRYYGRPQDMVTKDRKQSRKSDGVVPNDNLSIVPSAGELDSHKIDKSVLTIGIPKRFRDKTHLRFVASHPCLVCGRQPSDPHHLKFSQPMALGLKVSDEFTVPLCRSHHRQLHNSGNEKRCGRI